MPMVKIEDIAGLSDFFCIVEEPAFSKNKLEQLQAKYGIDTKSFITYEEFYTQVGLEDAKDWKFNYTIYINSGGVLDDLISPLIAEYPVISREINTGQVTGGDEMSPPFFISDLL